MSTATTTAAASGTVFEREARARKVLRLCMALDSALDMMGADPFSARALEFVLAMTDAAWKCAASHANVPMPSALTKLAVEQVYTARLNTRRALARIS